MNDITLAGQVIAKIFSGMFLTGEGLAVVGVFALAGIAFWIKAKIEQN
jgi:hypothetical protein